MGAAGKVATETGAAAETGAADGSTVDTTLSDTQLFRQGQLPEFEGDPDATFLKGSQGQWATENPLSNPNYANDLGLPSANSGAPDWVAGGHINPDAGSVGFGPSEGIGPNAGGAPEFSVSPSDVTIDWFHMPD